MAISRENIRKETKAAQRKVMAALRKQAESRGVTWSDIEDASDDDVELRNLQEWQHAAKVLDGFEEKSAGAENLGDSAIARNFQDGPALPLDMGKKGK